MAVRNATKNRTIRIKIRIAATPPVPALLPAVDCALAAPPFPAAGTFFAYQLISSVYSARICRSAWPENMAAFLRKTGASRSAAAFCGLTFAAIRPAIFCGVTSAASWCDMGALREKQVRCFDLLDQLMAAKASSRSGP